jgi:hypothetical protein
MKFALPIMALGCLIPQLRGALGTGKSLSFGQADGFATAYLRALGFSSTIKGVNHGNSMSLR